MTDPTQFRSDSVAAALNEIGDRWTFLVLRECFYGVRRFSQFQRNLGVARNILSDRLSKLVEHKILQRHPYTTTPPREEYRLTEKGLDLYGLTIAYMRWADRWISERPALTLTHASDGGEIEQQLRCTTCGQELTARDVTWQHTAGPDTAMEDIGPGARQS